MKNKCCNCQHENVCKYKEKYENTLNNIHELKIERPFTIEVDCFFYNPNTYLNYKPNTYLKTGYKEEKR